MDQQEKELNKFDYITTYTGTHFYPTNPDPEQIHIEDIAHALPMLCRGNGHVKKFFSVGQHCIFCAKEARARGYSDRVVLACLLHDAAECYMSDVPRPFKKYLDQYLVFEDRILDLIYEKYLGSRLTEEEQTLLKQVDDDLLYYDLTILIGEPMETPAPEVHIEIDYTVKSFEEVERQYLELFKELTGIDSGIEG